MGEFGGCDLVINDNCNINHNNHSFLGCKESSFDFESEIKYPFSQDYLAGSKNFRVIEYEVFKVVELKL